MWQKEEAESSFGAVLACASRLRCVVAKPQVAQGSLPGQQSSSYMLLQHKRATCYTNLAEYHL